MPVIRPSEYKLPIAREICIGMFNLYIKRKFKKNTIPIFITVIIFLIFQLLFFTIIHCSVYCDSSVGREGLAVLVERFRFTVHALEIPFSECYGELRCV